MENNTKDTVEEQLEEQADAVARDELAARERLESVELPAAILFALDVEKNFKLYSYRCVRPEMFVSETKKLIDFFLKANE